MIKAIANKPQVVRQIDIARALGVSRSAVACALTQSEHGRRRYRINAETERLIKETAAKMGYTPSYIGRSLKHRKSFLVGLLNSASNYTLHAELNAGIQEVLIEHDYAPVVFTHDQLAAEQKNLRLCLDRDIEGLLINCAIDGEARTEAARIAELSQNGLPVVELFGHFVPEVPSAAIDFHATGVMAVEKLWKLGHRRIALFIHDRYRRGAKALPYWMAYDLWKGYCAGLKRYSLKPLVISSRHPGEMEGPYSLYQTAYEAGAQAINHPARPNGFVVFNWRSAIGMLDYVRDHHPEHLDGIHAVSLGLPESIAIPSRYLTLLLPPARKVGQAAARLLIEMIHDQTSGKIRPRYPDALIPPES